MTNPMVHSRVIRDMDDSDHPEVLVTTIADLVLVEMRYRRTGALESVLVHPAAARRIAAALVVEAMRAEMVAAMAEGEGKGGGDHA